MDSLIERIEAATGPDRRLNADILLRLGWASDGHSALDPKGRRVASIPYYVGSIDEAVTLVPDGFEWCLEYQAGHHVSCEFECMIAIAKLGDPCFDWEATAATPALAICAAALKARTIPHDR